MQSNPSVKPTRSPKPMPYPVLKSISKDGSLSFSTLPSNR
jgi:hypothetical protein